MNASLTSPLERFTSARCPIMSIASSAGRHTRVRPAESREPSRNRMHSVNARRAMQEAAIPVTKDMHTAAAVAALTPSRPAL